VCPKVLGTDGVVRIALDEEVLKKAHILKAEDGNLMLGLRHYTPVRPSPFQHSTTRLTWCTTTGIAGYSHFSPVLTQ